MSDDAQQPSPASTAEAAPDAPAAEAAPGSAPGEYEFGHEENMVIGACGNRARIFGILCAVSGAMQLIAGILNLAGLVDGNLAAILLPAGVFNLVLGILFTRVSTALSKVVTTAGRDVTLMMEALGNMSRAFMVQIIATVLFMLVVISLVITFAALSRAMPF